MFRQSEHQPHECRRLTGAGYASELGGGNPDRSEISILMCYQGASIPTFA
jgi:hypothetical protein